MKFLQRYILLCFALIALGTGKVFAQKAAVAAQGQADTINRGAWASRLQADLGLTPQQAAALQQLMEQNRNELRQIRQRQGYTPLQKQKLLISAMQDGDLRLGSVLSKAQLDKLKEVWGQRAARFKAGMADPEARLRQAVQPRQPLSGGTLKSVKTIKP